MYAECTVSRSCPDRGAAGALDFNSNGDILSGTYRIWRVENGSFIVIQTIAFP